MYVSVRVCLSFLHYYLSIGIDLSLCFFVNVCLLSTSTFLDPFVTISFPDWLNPHLLA